ncbi:MAG: sigma-54-dependent Fis family transcriptional regulator, partial [Candidatus Aminicenantes bacterium]|nr:sigma-54-dependent Fis family transcriptional regulator [Candidatus Aminicenantes bacterium]
DEAFGEIPRGPYRVVFLDAGCLGAGARRALSRIKKTDPLAEVVICSDGEAEKQGIDWILAGGSDILTMPLQAEAVRLVLQKAVASLRLRRETYLLEKKLEKKYVFQGIIGKSPALREALSLAGKVARHFSVLLICGETGTGKELVAAAVQRLSPRRQNKMVVCDSTAIPENLFESELFGHVRGAFTGAVRDKRGLFEEADGGILFLDEIGELPLPVQAKLLRVLETHEVRRLGATESRKVDVRIITATNRRLEELVGKREFREDLYHRLNKVVIQLPPLRERPEDILLLTRHFIDHFSRKFGKPVRGCSQRVQKLFAHHPWPGNVRELRNVIERAVILCDKDFIDLDNLPATHRDSPGIQWKRFSGRQTGRPTLKELEKDYISFLLEENRYNIRETARLLDINRSTLYEKLKEYGIQVKRLTGRPSLR